MYFYGFKLSLGFLICKMGVIGPPPPPAQGSFSPILATYLLLFQIPLAETAHS